MGCKDASRIRWLLKSAGNAHGDPMTNLQNKVVLVTGATSGIGRAAALHFARDGAAVVLGGRRRDAGEALVAEIVAAGGRAVFRATEVSRYADHQALVELALSTYGQLHVAFNNAGIEATGPLIEFNDQDYDTVFNTNVRGVFLAIRAQIPALTKTRGSIILTSSTAGTRGFAGAAIYTASKHAVEGIMKSAAHELAPLGIRVNVVAPGPTATAMLDRFTGGHPEVMAARVPLGRAATPEEVAAAAVWLGSDDARFVSGTSISVNGGLTA
jgi:NAD(P)-dependent dehydrogenase (short-subunit alcohol dehydrogenase family)